MTKRDDDEFDIEVNGQLGEVLDTWLADRGEPVQPSRGYIWASEATGKP